MSCLLVFSTTGSSAAESKIKTHLYNIYAHMFQQGNMELSFDVMMVTDKSSHTVL
jgi:hypothetical protein